MSAPFGLICALTMLCAAVPLGAAPEDSDGELVLTLDDAVARALEHSVNLQKGRITLETREYASKRLWAEVFPTISATAGIGYQNIPLFTASGDRRMGGEYFNYSTSIGVSLSLSAGIPQRMKLLSLAYQQELLSYEDTRRLLEIATAQEFYALIAVKENLAQHEETLGLAERQLEKHRIGRANGLVSEAVLLQSRLTVETAKYDLSAARSAYSTRLGVFLNSLGLALETPVKLEGEFHIRRVAVDAEQLIRDYLPRRPDIEQQRQAIAKAELTERQNILDRRAPSLSLSLGWQGGSGSGGFTQPYADSIRGSATVSIPINPWIPGTRDAQNLRSDKSEIERALLDLKNTEDTAAAQIRSLAASLESSWESLEIARLREEIAGRSYEYSEQAFLNGSMEALALENSRNNLASARYQLLTSELNYQNLVLDLARAVNADWRQFSGGSL
ncbi:MAG: TolC family protein [Treponema sp.]|jgi:outer membrane protein TolC|nr:TolC family protein [Treponema sp.]